MKNSISRKSLTGLLAAALLTAAACSEVEQDTLSPVTVVSEITLADGEGYPLKTSDVLPVIIGTPVQLSYTVAPQDATRPGVQFSVSDPAVASVSETGLITGLTDGQTTLTVAPLYAFSTSIAITLDVVTTPIPVASIEFDAGSLPAEFFVGQTATLRATPKPANATFKRLAFSSLDEQIATITPEGFLTGISKGTTTIRVSATDGSGVYADHELFVDQVIPVEKADLIAPVHDDPTDYEEWAAGETCQLTFTMTPANGSAYTLKWASSNPAVLEVSDEGLVRFLAGGTASVSLTCPETGYTSTLDFTVGEGLLRDDLRDENNLRWEVNPSHIKQGATQTWMQTYINVSTYLSGTTGRADFQRTASTTLHAGNYPILAIKMTNPADTHKAEGVTQCRITLDAAPGLGAYGNSYNKYTALDCDDGIPVYYYDLAAGTFGGAKVQLSTAAPTPLTVFQFKIADIKTISAPVEYNVYWVRTFKSLEDLQAYAKAHPEEAPAF